MNFGYWIFAILCSLFVTLLQPPAGSASRSHGFNRALCSYFAGNPSGFEQLGDVLPGIFSYLNIADLNSVRQVCGKLQDFADYERLRRGPDLRMIDIKQYSQKYHSHEPHPARNLYETIRIDPSSVIVFTDHRVPPDTYESLHRELIFTYMFTLPRTTTLIHVEGTFTILDGQVATGANNDAIGLFFEDKSGFEVTHIVPNVAMMPQQLQQVDTFAKKVFEEVFDLDEIESVTLIIFHLDLDDENSKHYNRFTQRFRQLLERRFSTIPPKLSLIGGHFDSISTYNLEIDPTMQTSWVGLLISGKRAASWSIHIDIQENPAVIRTKLYEFKTKVNFKSARSVGLIIQSGDEQDSTDPRGSKVAIISEMFPNLRIIHFGNAQDQPKFCIDSTIPQSSPELVFKGDQYVCFMIITYKSTENSLL